MKKSLELEHSLKQNDKFDMALFIITTNILKNLNDYDLFLYENRFVADFLYLFIKFISQLPLLKLINFLLNLSKIRQPMAK